MTNQLLNTNYNVNNLQNNEHYIVVCLEDKYIFYKHSLIFFLTYVYLRHNCELLRWLGTYIYFDRNEKSTQYHKL